MLSEVFAMEVKVDDYSIPTNLKYTKTHEWAASVNGSFKIGVTDYAQKSLHEVVYVELPEVGKKVKAGETVAVLESTKAIADVYSPVDGEVVEVNAALEGSPELINKDPYGEGWICVIKAEGEPKDLLTPEQYAELIRKELSKS